MSNCSLGCGLLQQLRIEKLYTTRRQVGIGAIALRDPWDAPPPTLEIVGCPLQLLQLTVILSMRDAGSLQCFSGPPC